MGCEPWLLTNRLCMRSTACWSLLVFLSVLLVLVDFSAASDPHARFRRSSSSSSSSSEEHHHRWRPPMPLFQPPPEFMPLVRSVNQFHSSFATPGQTYNDVMQLLQLFYQRNSPNGQFNFANVHMPTGVSGWEQGPNTRFAGGLFEVDVVLTMQQARLIAGGRQRRMLLSRYAQFWPALIPYVLLDTDATWRNQVRAGINFLARNTCLRFREQASNVPGDHIVYYRGEGCLSGLGRLGGAQRVSIGSGCEQMGIVVHETAHALGFWHEHSRPDRDSYIRINRANMIAGVDGQFLKRNTNEAETQSIPFDYGSVMHYADTAYSKSSTQPTISTVDPLYHATIGNRHEPSFLDLKHINALYCPRTCRPLACVNGGYADPNNCAVCKCPRGLGGTFCGLVQASSCSRELWAESAWQSVVWSGSTDCFWRIRARTANQRVEFQVSAVYFACAPTCIDYLEIKHHNDLSVTGARLCCRPEGAVRTTDGRSLLLMSKTARAASFTFRYRLAGGTPAVRQAAPRQAAAITATRRPTVTLRPTATRQTTATRPAPRPAPTQRPQQQQQQQRNWNTPPWQTPWGQRGPWGPPDPWGPPPGWGPWRAK